MYTTTSSPTPRLDLLGPYSTFNGQNLGFVADQVLPMFAVGEESGQMATLSTAVWTQQINTIRALKAATSTADWAFGSDTWQTVEYSHMGLVDRRAQRLYQSLLNAEGIEAARCAAVIAAHRERVTADLVFNTTTFNTAGVNRTTLATPWDVAGGTPLTDVATARYALEANYGIPANTLIITSYSVSKLMVSTQFRNAFTGFYPGGLIPAMPSVEHLKAIFGIENVIIPRARKNAAAPNATPSLAPIWDEDLAMVCRIESGPDVTTPQLGRTFTLDGNGVRIETWDSNDPPGRVVRCEQIIQPKLMATPIGHLISNVKT